MNKKLVSLDKKSILFCCFVFIAFTVLAYLFPYSGDDWAWGSQIGIERFNTNFDNYNGRYAGNLLVMLLTRNRIIRTLFISGSMLLLSLLPKMYSKSKGVSSIALAAFLLLITPKEIFVQSVVWTSGYANYIPPILITVLYFVIVRNIFEEGIPKYSKFMPIVTLILGFSASLFMENVTLFSVAVSFLIMVFTLIKFKKLYFTQVAYFVGAVAGAVMMFTNSAYGLIADNSDGYRSTALSEGLKETLISHSETISELLFIDNLPIFFVISVLSVFLTMHFVKSNNNNAAKTIAYGSLFINILSLFILFAKNKFTYWLVDVNSDNAKLYTLYFVVLSICAYCLSVFVSVVVCVKENNDKFKMLLVLASVPVVTAPLLVVNPIGPRCFFPPYFLLIVFGVVLYDYLKKEMKFSSHCQNTLFVTFTAGCMASLVFLFSIYSTIYTYDMKRNEYVQKQVDAGHQDITICKLPYGSYVWTGDPASSPWNERYKLFYGFDKDLKFEFVSYSEFDEWIEFFNEN